MPEITEQRARELAAIAKLPADDIPRLAELIKDAAQTYDRRASSPSIGEVRAEIKGLVSAADRGDYETLAGRREQLSEATRAWLERRGRHRTVNVEIPTPDALRDPELQHDACAAIIRLCRIGGNRGPGRNRPSGKQSVSFKSVLYLPKPQDHPPRREAERRFVEDLRSAWRACGLEPAATANPNRPGPFARFVQACLDAVQSGANAVVLINDLSRHERQLEKLLSTSSR
jgi:hypothetical protein